MQKLPKEYWKISFINKKQEQEWDRAYSKLEAGYRWQVDSALQYMTHYKQPWKKFPKKRCKGCRKGLYLIDVSHKGIGSKIVHMMVFFDNKNHKLTPVHCEVI